ncbi:MAG: hypothetical protein JW841_15315 [Deltaproteobacteria bacterium]|nr:hypothetical protein [Deltaproteobacteria bacterium]
MNHAQLLASLKHLNKIPTAPFYEFDITNALHAIIRKHGLDYSTDAYGNTLIHIYNGKPKHTVAFVAHLDHPAFQVVAVNKKHVICTPTGQIPIVGLAGTKVLFPKCKNGPLSGHIHSIKTTHGTPRRLKQAVIQIAAQNHLPAINDFAIFDLLSFKQRGPRLHLRVADDLAGVCAILAALVRLARNKSKCDAWGIFTRAEEVGFHGAIALAKSNFLKRDTTIISVECSNAYGDITLGKGPVVRLGDRSGPFNPRAVALVAGAARHLDPKKFLFQSALMSTGSCEATAFNAFGYPSAGIALPLKNYHNLGSKRPVPEQIDARDLFLAVDLIFATAERAGDGVDDLSLLRQQLVKHSKFGRRKLLSTHHR